MNLGAMVIRVNQRTTGGQQERAKSLQNSSEPFNSFRKDFHLVMLQGNVRETKDTVRAFRLGVLPGVPSQRLLESYFLWILVEKSTVVRPPGVDLEGGPTVYSRSPTLTVLLVLPNMV